MGDIIIYHVSLWRILLQVFVSSCSLCQGGGGGKALKGSLGGGVLPRPLNPDPAILFKTTDLFP